LTVPNVGEGEQLDRVVQQIIQAAQLQQPVVPGDGHISQLGAGAFGQQLPGDDVAVMFHLCQQDGVAGADVLTAPGMGNQIDALGGSARENDFGRLAGVEENRGALAGCLEGHGRASAQFVNAAMDVAVVMTVKPVQRLQHHAGFLRGGGVVKINERMPVDFLPEDGKVLP
jgi:hypothetical protein